MDQKTWLWRKRSSEKTIVANGEEEKSKEVDLESSLQTLNEKLASMVDECSAKDKLVENLKQMADDAMADKNKAEEESRRLKDELDQVLDQGLTANERLTHLNSALKDCMDQLNALRNEHDKRVHEAVIKTSNEFEKGQKKLEEKLTETSKRLAAGNAENSYLTKALLVKDKLIDELQTIKNRMEAEFEAMMSRLDSTDKENAFLRYEYRTIEKELELRNEELEYCRRSAEVLNKQHLESVKKIKKLEGDCQRLRVLTRKRLPGQQLAYANVRSDFDGRRKSMPAYPPVDKKIELLIGQMHDLERENEILKEFLVKKEEEILNYQKVKNSEHSDKFKDRMIGASEMSLMDDFVEMEKLAIVAVDVPLGGSFSTSEVSRSLSDSSKEISMTKELVPIGNGPSSDWLQNVTDAILEQHRISKQSVEELIGEVKMALNSFVCSELSKSVPISGYITWKSPASTPRSNPIQEPVDVNTSLRKIIELLGKFDENSDMPDFKIHAFGWKSREISSVLKEFLHNCNDLLTGTIGYEKFIGDLVATLEWIINNGVTYNDRSAVRDEFKKHLGGDGPGTALELECVQNLMLEMDKTHSILRAEIKGLKDELNWIKLSEDDPVGSSDILASLRKEVEVLKESGNQIENLKAMNEDLETQLSVTKAKLNEVAQKLSCVEVELEDKSRCCEELEGTCLELQLQLESTNKSRHADENGNHEVLLQTGMEITKASAKLAECEETIVKLGKQLKGLGSSKELSVVERVLSMTGKKFNKQRSSLRDQMLSEDNLRFSREMNGPLSISRTSSRHFSCSEGGEKYFRARTAKSGALVIVPSNKKGGRFGLLTKLLLRRKKGSSKNSNTSLW